MSDAAVSRTAVRARVGPTLRAVLLAPEAGFAAAARAAQRREQAGRRPSEGFAPGVIATLGFGALGLLWLRLASLLNLREVAAADFRWDYLVASFALIGLVGLGVQQLWGLVGPTAVRLLFPGLTAALPSGAAFGLGTGTVSSGSGSCRSPSAGSLDRRSGVFYERAPGRPARKVVGRSIHYGRNRIGGVVVVVAL